jgi:hypothetical protein
MKLVTKSLLLAVISAATLSLSAQEAAPTAPPAGEHRRPASPVMAALDANGDGVVDAAEIANAANALAALDKNGDGQLTKDELRPARPEGGRGPGGPGGPSGKKGPHGGPKPE